MKLREPRFAFIVFVAPLISTPCLAGEARPPSQTDWGKTVEAARKEGSLVAAIPASAELRKAIGDIFPKRFPGIDLDLTNASKIAAPHAAGVSYYDLLIRGTSTPFNLLYANILDGGFVVKQFLFEWRIQLRCVISIVTRNDHGQFNSTNRRLRRRDFLRKVTAESDCRRHAFSDRQLGVRDCRIRLRIGADGALPGKRSGAGPLSRPHFISP